MWERGVTPNATGQAKKLSGLGSRIPAMSQAKDAEAGKRARAAAVAGRRLPLLVAGCVLGALFVAVLFPLLSLWVSRSSQEASGGPGATKPWILQNAEAVDVEDKGLGAAEVERLQSLLNAGGSVEELALAVAGERRVLMVSTFSSAWAPLLEAFLKHLRTGSNTRYLLSITFIVCMDDESHATCSQLHPLCYKLELASVGGEEAAFMSEKHQDICWRRLQLFRRLLAAGVDVLATDLDIWFFQDPLARLQEHPEDLQMSSDFYNERSPSDSGPNAGFSFARANIRTVAFYDYWYSLRSIVKMHEQDTFAQIRPRAVGDSWHYGRPEDEAREGGPSLRFLPTAEFSCFFQIPANLTAIVTLHANCCFGMSNKLRQLAIVEESRRWYSRLDPRLQEELATHRIQHVSPLWCANFE